MRAKTPYLGLNIRGPLGCGGAPCDPDASKFGPQPGDVFVPGVVIGIQEIPGFRLSGKWPPTYFGKVQASNFPSPPAPGAPGSDSSGTDPRTFSFWTLVPMTVGTEVLFDVFEGPGGGWGARNVQPLDGSLEAFSSVVVRALRLFGEHAAGNRIEKKLDELYGF